MFKVPERYRVISGKLKSNALDGNNGLFQFSMKQNQNFMNFNCIASDGLGWQHVSVTCRNKKRCPTWDEMCFIKSKFWGEDDTVIQYHPKKSEYVSHHDYCLHLWRPIDKDFPKPPSELVGPKKN